MDEKRTYISDYTGDDTVPDFVTFCIEQYKKYKNISGEKAYVLLSETGVLDYLAKHYDALHLESSNWIMKTIDEMVNSKVLVNG